MALDSSDFIDNLLDEQARLNSIADDGDVANLVADFQIIAGELIGMQADGVATSTSTPPHKWNDTPGTNTVYGFFKWA